MEPFIAVLICILFDIITGLIKAVYFGNINSTYLRKGLLHKATEILTMAGSTLCEYALQYINLGFDLPMVKVTAAYICLMEIVSVIENIAEVNPQLGKFLKPYLDKLKKEEEEKGE